MEHGTQQFDSLCVLFFFLHSRAHSSAQHWLAPCVMCEVGFYSMAGGDMFRNLWGLEMKPHTVWPSKVTWGLKVCLQAAQLSAAFLKTRSVSCGVSWPDEAGGTRATAPFILLSVLNVWNAGSGGSDYREQAIIQNEQRTIRNLKQGIIKDE